MKNKRPFQYISVLCYCTALMLCVYSGDAYGFIVATTSGYEIHWPTPQADYRINTSGFPAAGSTAIQAAMQTWTDVSTSNFSFIYQGTTSSTAYGVNDGANLICFGALGAGYNTTLALNTGWYTAQGTLLDCDIKFNSIFPWATDSSASAYDLQTIVLHELGHSLALEDLYGAGDTAKVMYGEASPGEIKRALTQDDKDGITHLYPAGGSTTTIPATTIPATTTAPSSSTTTAAGGPCPAQKVLGADNPKLENLRAFRDGLLAQSKVGRRITQIYYDNADSINAALERSPALRAVAQKLFEAAAALAGGKQEPASELQ